MERARLEQEKQAALKEISLWRKRLTRLLPALSRINSNLHRAEVTYLRLDRRLAEIDGRLKTIPPKTSGVIRKKSRMDINAYIESLSPEEKKKLRRRLLGMPEEAGGENND